MAPAACAPPMPPSQMPMQAATQQKARNKRPMIPSPQQKIGS